jgi:ligand-binding sensor protein
MVKQDKTNFNPDFNLKDLIDIKAWQKVQDNFSEVTEVSLRTVDIRGDLLTNPSRPARLCNFLMKDSSLKDKICGACIPTFLGGKGIVDRNLTFHCEAEGIYNFVAPLRLDDNKDLGYVVLGPVILVMRKNKEEYRKIAEDLGLTLEDFWSALLEIKVMSFQGMQSLIELIKDVGQYAMGLAYKNIMKKEGTLTFESANLKLKKLFELLMDVAFEISGADIGSIMFFDKTSDAFTIRVSRGIPEEVAINTKIKLGDGISGTVAEGGKPVLLDNETKDNRIKQYLTRPYINSSMVLPFKSEDRVVGIMNLAALQTSPIKFNKENLDLMNRLIDLASIAIQETPL